MPERDLGIQQDDGRWEVETEIVVVGAGGAGLAAGLAAAQGGAQTMVLEKHRRPLSNTGRSGGMIPAAGTAAQKAAGITEKPAEFARDILDKNGHSANAGMVEHMARTARHLIEWLTESCHVDLRFVDDFKYPGHSQCRMHAPKGRTGAELVSDLRRALFSLERADLVEATPCIGLVVDGAGEVCGVIAEQGGEALRIRAQKVILACNGFGGNRQLVARHCPAMRDAFYFGGEGSTGEGILWGQALGAKLAFMDAYQAHSTVAMPGEILITYAVVMEGGVQVNRNGERFGNETTGYSEHAIELLKQPPLDETNEAGVAASRAFVIYDERIHQLARAFDDYRAAEQLNLIKQAATVPELAQKLGLDRDRAQATLAAYQECARTGALDAFGRSDCRLLVGPFYAVKVTGALFHTQGGLAVNYDAQVMGKDEKALPNLYAAGGCAAGISGHGPGGYLSGNGLLTALGYGMLAGRHAARAVREHV